MVKNLKIALSGKIKTHQCQNKCAKAYIEHLKENYKNRVVIEYKCWDIPWQGVKDLIL